MVKVITKKTSHQIGNRNRKCVPGFLMSTDLNIDISKITAISESIIPLILIHFQSWQSFT